MFVDLGLSLNVVHEGRNPFHNPLWSIIQHAAFDIVLGADLDIGWGDLFEGFKDEGVSGVEAVVLVDQLVVIF